MVVYSREGGPESQSVQDEAIEQALLIFVASGRRRRLAACCGSLRRQKKSKRIQPDGRPDRNLPRSRVQNSSSLDISHSFS